MLRRLGRAIFEVIIMLGFIILIVPHIIWWIITGRDIVGWWFTWTDHIIWEYLS